MSIDNLKYIERHEKNVRLRVKDLPRWMRPDWLGFERHYKDGTCLILSTDAKVYKHHFDKNNRLIGKPLPQHEGRTFDDDVGIEHLISYWIKSERFCDEVNIFGFNSVFVYRQYNTDYFDSFYWAHKKSIEKGVNIIINCTDELKTFPHIFLRAFSPVLRKRKGLIEIPNEMREDWDLLMRDIEL